jgi:hypothetical protein
MDAIARSGLLARLDCLYVINVGGDIGAADLGVNEADKVHIVNYSPDVRHHERATLDLVRRFARVHPESRVLYLHTKGASYDPPHPFVADWTEYLLHFVVDRHDACLAALDDHDVVGCNRREGPAPHFSGNFWWARAEHLEALPPVPAGDRHAAEFWVLGRSGVRSLSLWESGVNHYEAPYPRERYAAAADLGLRP